MHENTTFCLIKNLRILHKSFFLDSSLRGLVRGLRGGQCIRVCADKVKEITPCFLEKIGPLGQQ